MDKASTKKSKRNTTSYEENVNPIGLRTANLIRKHGGIRKATLLLEAIEGDILDFDERKIDPKVLNALSGNKRLILSTVQTSHRVNKKTTQFQVIEKNDIVGEFLGIKNTNRKKRFR